MAELSFFDKVHKNDTIHTPDVLACLANLSNDEVFTPPEVVNQMLDLLPQELFSDPNTKFLDPACKTGVFLREIAKRLIVGLEDKIPNLNDRLEHIFKEQLYGIAITELTSLLSRRSVYCSKYPNGQYSVVKFNNAEGNIRFRKTKHTWKDGKCIFCGASKETWDRSERFESHAYEFIHSLKPEDIWSMKFDVIIGNPPYQLEDGGNGASAKPIYHLFIEQSKKLNPRYLCMIIPARWYAGGKGLDEFRREMLEDKAVSHLVDFVNAKDCFPGTSIGGGVCYFLREKNYKGVCEYVNIHDGKKSVMERALDEYPVFVRYNEAISIIQKVASKKEPAFSDLVGSRNPFGFSSSARGSEDKLEYRLISSAGEGFVSKSEILCNRDIADKYKIMISKVTAEHAGEPDKSGMFTVLSTTKVLLPKEVCTDSYLIVYPKGNKESTINCAEYMKSKFFRFLLLQAVSSINLSKDKFQFIPLQDFSEEWTDEKLYKKYGLTDTEVEFIEGMIKEKSGSVE